MPVAVDLTLSRGPEAPETADGLALVSSPAFPPAVPELSSDIQDSQFSCLSSGQNFCHALFQALWLLDR